MKKTHFHLREEQTFFLKVSQNPLQAWEKIQGNNISYSTIMKCSDLLKIITKCSIYSFKIKCFNRPLELIILDRQMIRWLVLLPFHCRFVIAFNIFMFRTICGTTLRHETIQKAPANPFIVVLIQLLWGFSC